MVVAGMWTIWVARLIVSSGKKYHFVPVNQSCEFVILPAGRQEVLFKINGSICGTKTLSATSQWETVEIATYEQGSEALNGIYSFIGYGRP